jgi:lysylphosphatidylglycerol synthetase-like protein (DUF2156 family)
MTEPQLELIVFIAMLVCGLLATAVLANILDFGKRRRKRRRFNYFRYLLLLLAPAGVTIWAAETVEARAVCEVFLVFAVLGSAAEWLIGYSYVQVVTERLWTYHRLSGDGNSSLLALPFWGLGGVFFLMVYRAILG